MTPRGREPLRADGQPARRIDLLLDEQAERALARIAAHLGIEERPRARQAREALRWAAQFLPRERGQTR